MNNIKNWIGSAFLLFYVSLFAYIAKYTVPAGDDFVNYLFFSETFSVIQSVISYLLRIGGRFTTMFIVFFGYSLGVLENYHVFTPLIIAFSLFSLYFVVTSLFSDIKVSSKILITLLLQSIWLLIAIDLSQTLYWYSGIHYYWTCSVLLIEFALIVNIYKGTRTKILLCLLGALVFLNSGASELSAAYQIPVFAGAALITAASGNKKCSLYMLIMLLIAFIGLGLQVFHTAHSYRASEFLPIFGPNPIPKVRNLMATYRVGSIAGLITSFHFFTRPLIIYFLLLYMPIISDNVKQPRFIEKMPFKFKIWHIYLFEIITACCFQAIGGYSMGNALYLRAMAIVRFTMTAQWILFFVFLYRNSKFIEWIRNIRIYRYKGIILLICLLFNINFSNLIMDYRIAPEYTRQLAERNEYLEQQKALGNLDVIVPPINVAAPRLFIGDMIPQRKKPFEQDYSKYHGFNSIREEDPIIAMAVAYNEEIRRLKEAADAGDEEAKLFFKTIEEEERTRLMLLGSLVQKGSVGAQYLMARYYDSSDNLTSQYITKNDALALEYYFKLADKGYRPARELLWTFYMGGLKTDRDSDILKWGLMSILFGL
ncbi:MAG: hypothetical protein FWH52_02680 [Synergistaceae bacterium]|nr:hypothetical protein [Synergistaceae bacterium]